MRTTVATDDWLPLLRFLETDSYPLDARSEEKGADASGDPSKRSYEEDEET